MGGKLCVGQWKTIWLLPRPSGHPARLQRKPEEVAPFIRDPPVAVLPLLAVRGLQSTLSLARLAAVNRLQPLPWQLPVLPGIFCPADTRELSRVLGAPPEMRAAEHQHPQSS